MTRRNLFAAVFGGAFAAIFGIPEIKPSPPLNEWRVVEPLPLHAWRMGIMDSYPEGSPLAAYIYRNPPDPKAGDALREFKWTKRVVPMGPMSDLRRRWYCKQVRMLPKNNERWL